jgi:hypothetical protein
MPWIRGGDTSATYPPVMRVAGLPAADGRSVNEVFGFVFRLATQSSAHLTDYVVDAGTVAMIGGANTDQLLALCLKAGLLKRTRVDGMVAYKVIDDPDFLHLRLKSEIEWERQQRADCTDPALAVPIRLRDGDLCRYCGVAVQWLGRPSKRSGTLDHLDPGQRGTVPRMVVACRGCNSELRDMAGTDRENLRPAPTAPFYSERTAEWLTDNGHPTAASKAPRPGSRPDDAPRTASTPTTGQRSGSQSVTAPGVSDPATAGHRAPATTESDLKVTSRELPVAIGTSIAGSGRDGSGNEPLLPRRVIPTMPNAPRRKRSTRGRNAPYRKPHADE